MRINSTPFAVPVQGEENDHSTDGCPGPTWCKSSGWPVQLLHCSTADIAACRFVLSLPSLTCCRSLPIPGYDFLLAQRISTSEPALFLRTARCWPYCTAERGTIPRRRRDSPHGLRLRRRPRRKWFRISHSWTPSSEAGMCFVPLLLLHLTWRYHAFLVPVVHSQLISRCPVYRRLADGSH